jgi:uncharacterized cupin superfamily protein
MDADILSAKGVVPRQPRIAYVEDHVVKLGSKAMLLPSPKGRAYGVLFQLTRAEMDRLYAGMDDYREQAFTAVQPNGNAIAAVSRVHVDPPVHSAEDPAYGVPFRALLRKLGLPDPQPAGAIALRAHDVAPRAKRSNYPAPFAALVAGRTKRQLGEAFGLSNFGVNLTTLEPGAVSAVRHAHTKQDEFVYILEGHPTLVTDEGRTPLSPGMCAGFPAGTGNGHHLLNETAADVVYFEVGDRTPGDEASYPDDDLEAMFVEGAWRFTRKDGTPY